MRGRKREGAAPPPPDAETTIPFFARFLEGQHDGDDAEAKVSARRGRAQATKKAGAKPARKLQTLKYPSDSDEYVFYPYHVEAATAKATRRTLKYPSDNDERGDPYVPVYLDAADAPKTATARPKKDAKVRLTTKAADIDEAAS
jgi:hypothetical protein